MRHSTLKAVEKLKAGETVQIQTFKGGDYSLPRRNIDNESIRPFAFFETCDLSFTGEYVGILWRSEDAKAGPFVDDYVQIKIMAERPIITFMYEGQKISGWESGEVIQSIPFRNISSVEVKI